MDKKQICKLTVIYVLIISLILGNAKRVYATELGNTVETETSVSDNDAYQDPLWPVGPAVDSASAVVVDLETGSVLYDKAGKEAHYPASITKVMTALVALENCPLDEKVVFSYYSVHSIEKGSSSIARDVDEVMTMEECIYGLLLESANECGNAIAEHVGGSIEGFAEMMNEKAKELGCVNTHFANPHGLHDPDHYTCAYDMALIARAAYLNPTFALITGTKQYTIPPTNKHAEPTYLNNHHAMLNYYRTNQYLYDYCVGGKTGYTSDALGTLVTYTKKDDITLVIVTMCGARPVYYPDTKNLSDYFFNSLMTTKVSELGEDMVSFDENSISRLVGGEEIPFKVDTNVSVLLPVGADLSKITVGLEKPGENNDNMGAIVFTYGNKVISRAPIQGKDIEVYPFKNIQAEGEDEASDYIVINVYRVALIAFGILAAVVLVILLIFRTNNFISVARRKRLENRDPHKNMRRIKRRRSRRNR